MLTFYFQNFQLYTYSNVSILFFRFQKNQARGDESPLGGYGRTRRWRGRRDLGAVVVPCVTQLPLPCLLAWVSGLAPNWKPGVLKLLHSTPVLFYPSCFTRKWRKPRLNSRWIQRLNAIGIRVLLSNWNCDWNAIRKKRGAVGRQRKTLQQSKAVALAIISPNDRATWPPTSKYDLNSKQIIAIVALI